MATLEELLDEASSRLMDTVDSIADEALGEPSLLPGWSVGHVLAHLALHAEAVTGALQSLAEGDAAVLYASSEARDAGIAELAQADADDLRLRLSVGIAQLAGSLTDLAPLYAEATFERTPGGARLPVTEVPLMRLSEVEIHHADLGLGYTHQAWPEQTVGLLLDREAARYRGEGFTAQAEDLGREWVFGEPATGPVVSGPGSALAWWATGRPDAGLLRSTTGELPGVAGR